MKNITLILLFLSFFFAGVSSNQSAAYAGTPSFADLAEKMLPSVVNVSTTIEIKQADKRNIPSFPKGSPFEDLFKKFYDQLPKGDNPKNKQQITKKISALGSGFIIDAKKGYIVTNNHVVKNADEIKIILNDNTTIAAKLLGVDEKTDLALLQVKTKKKLTAVKWGDSDKMRVGAWILAIGNPFGLGGTVTAGIISARHRNINSGPYDEYIQTDASINKGNSGGPMFNLSGEVVGINTAIYSPTGGSVGIGFAIPSNMAKAVISQLIKYGKTKRGWLGVRIQTVTPEIAENLNLNKAKGAMVASVNLNGPAEKAGIKAGDIILEFNGKSVDKMHSLPRLVADSEVGKKVAVSLWRKGRLKTIHVVLGQLEKAEEKGFLKNKHVKTVSNNSTELKSLDIDVSALDNNLRKQYKLSNDVKGVIIIAVKAGSNAAEKGLKKGDVIVELNQKEVNNPKQAKKIISKAKKNNKTSVLLFVSRGDNMRFVALKFKKAK